MANSYSFRRVAPVKMSKKKDDTTKPNGDRVKVYVAFSVHGTNSFAKAEKYVTQDELAALLKNGFTKVTSRDPRNTGGTDVKLHWNSLTNKTTGQPYRSRTWVMRRFEELAAQGWTIDISDFKVGK